MNQILKNCTGLCPAFYIYVSLSILGILMYLYLCYEDSSNSFENLDSETLVISLIYKLVWGIIIYYLCATCHESIAMFLVFMPLIFVLWLILMMFILSHKHIIRIIKN